MRYKMWNFNRFSLICIAFSIVVVSVPQILQAQTYEEQINSLSATMAKNIEKSGKKQIAVVDFTDLEGNVTALGRFIAEEFSVALLNTGSEFEVVDRTHLQTILKEHKLSTTGIIDPQTARKLGQIAGVEALITGTLTPFGESIRVTVKILDVNTAKVIGASAGNIPQTKPIETLLAQGIATPEMPPEPKRTSTPPKSVDTPTPRPTPQANQVVESRGLIFTLQECRRAGKDAACHLLITSDTQDRDLMIFGHDKDDRISRIFDNLGNEYPAKKSVLSNKSGGNVSSFLVAGVPTKATLHFEALSSQARIITLLELTCTLTGDWFGERFKVQFRNIPLEGISTESTKPTAPLAEIQQMIESKGFTFTLQECKKSGESVKCNFLITNNGQDKQFAIKYSTGTRMFDDLGNEYKTNRIELGTNYSASWGWMRNSLVTGIPIKLSISFKGVTSQAGMIALLEVYCSSGEEFTAQFRNIPFSK